MSEIFEVEPEYGNSAGRVNMTGYSGSKWREVRIDSSTRAMNIIEYAHHEVHGGSAFSINYVEDLAAAKSSTNIFVTPLSTKEVHVVFGFEVEAEADIKIYEGVTITTSGTSHTFFNKNRVSTTTSSALFFTGAVVATTGTALILHHHPGSGKKVGGGTRGQQEWILKSNTVYSIVLLNSTVGANQTDIELDWYEHAQKAA